MVGLITLPIRLTARAGSLALRTTEAVVNRALGIAGSVVGHATGRTQSAPDESSPAQSRRTRSTSSTRTRERAPQRDPRSPRPQQPEPAPETEDPETAAAEAVAAEPAVPEPPAPEPAPTPPAAGTPSEPVHVSEEPELVEEFAEPGAEDGAGAEVTVDEPWDGYSQLKADEVVSRVGEADAAELAAITLYERAHHNRDTVLEAVERQLQLTFHKSTQMREEQPNG